MTLDFYYCPRSAPCRSVMLTAEAIGLDLNLKRIQMSEGEHLMPEFEQLNPLKKIPVLVDGDYKLCESRAIMGYLVDEYGNNEWLYPTSPAARALVNQRLHFDIGTLYKFLSAYYYPPLMNPELEPDPNMYEKLEKAFVTLDRYLDNQDYVTGRNMTIADLSLISSVTTAEVLGFDISKFENVEKWVEKVKSSAPGYRSATEEGLEMLREFKESRDAPEE